MEIVLVEISIGIVSALIGSILGLGGGIVIVPALIYLSPFLYEHPISVASAVGTSLAVIVVTALSSLVKFSRQARVDWKSGWTFVLGSAPASMISSFWTAKIPEGLFQIIFGCFLLFIVSLLTFQKKLQPLPTTWLETREYVDPQGITHRYGYSIGFYLLIGMFAGLVSGLFGIGGGALLVPMMLFCFGFPIHVATATSMLVVCLAALSGTGIKAFHGEVMWSTFLALAPGAVLGGWIGAWWTGKLTKRRLMNVFRIGMMILALYLILDGIYIWVSAP